MISNGQARRIAAEWQAPGYPTSMLQHVGLIHDDLTEELRGNRRYAEDEQSLRELNALIEFSETHGPGKVAEWGDWDDTPVR